MKPLSKITTDFTGGINENSERVSLNQCAEAMNVWMPEGVVEQRPGTRDYPYLWNTGGAAPASNTIALFAEDVHGIAPQFTAAAAAPGTLQLLGAPMPNHYTTARSGDQALGTYVEGDRWYVGFSALVGGYYGYMFMLPMVAGQLNTNAVRAEAEYWNGTEWVYFPHSECSAYPPKTPYGGTGAMLQISRASSPHLAPETALALYFTTGVLSNWAQTTVNALTRYYIRFTLVSITGAAATLTNNTTIDNGSVSYGSIFGLGVGIAGIFAPQFPTCKRYITLGRAYWLGTPVFNYLSLHKTASSLYGNDVVVYPHNYQSFDETPPTMALIPQTEEAFIAYNRRVLVFKANPQITRTSAESVATVESGDFAVGPMAPWDKELIAQLPEFPKAKFIAHFQGRLWCVDENDMLRWSAAVPYHKVWPSLAFEPLSEVDNSPVTGMVPYQEHMVIFKQDSIWIASYTQTDTFGIPHYVPRRVVAGIGCVANGSIKEIQGRLIFLSENGIYAFDGIKATNVGLDRKLKVDRISSTIGSIKPGTRKLSAAAHWRTKHCYLLAVNLEGKTSNTHIIVWDYLNDVFFLWSWKPGNSRYPVCFCEDEDQYDNEEILYGRYYGCIGRFTGEHDDNVAITASVKTVQLGHDTGRTFVLRGVGVTSQNNTDALDMSLYRNGDTTASDTATINFADYNEAHFGTAIFGTSIFARLMDRVRGLYYRLTGQSFQVMLSTNRAGRPFWVSKVQLLVRVLRRGFDR